MMPTISVYTITAKGPRPYQEDTFFTEDLGKGRILLGVFDGHGGDDVSKKCAAESSMRMHRLLAENPGDPGLALRKLYTELDEACRENLHEGACAAIAYVTREKVWFSNCGDCMIACKIKRPNGESAMFVTKDHKVADLAEQRRLKAMGAVITFNDCPRIFDRLNIARSIGDWALKPYVISTPFISCFNLRNTKDTLEGIVIASDGLWDVMDAQTYWHISEITESFRGEVQLNDALQYAYEHGSTDNITVVHCKLQNYN
jgi:serine/threonine protein phosphatase PrpC